MICLCQLLLVCALQVAEALVQLAGGEGYLSAVCVLGDDARHEVDSFLREKRVPKVDILDLQVTIRALAALQELIQRAANCISTR